MPTAVPSTFTCTPVIAVPIVVVLSRAQPEIVIVPVTAELFVGESMETLGCVRLGLVKLIIAVVEAALSVAVIIAF